MTEPTRPAAPSGSGKQMWRPPGLAEGEVLAGRFRIDAAARAQAQGLTAWALEARLTEGEILAKGGAEDAAGAKLTQVEKDAASKGFRRIAREAGKARGA